MKFLSPKKNAIPASTRSPSPIPMRAATPPVKKGYFASLRLRTTQPHTLAPTHHPESFFDDPPEHTSMYCRPGRGSPPPKTPYPVSRALFSHSLPSVQRMDDSPPRIQTSSTAQPVQRSPGLLAALRRTTQRPEPLNVAQASTSASVTPRTRRRSFGVYIRGVGGASSAKAERNTEPQMRAHTPAPELPPLPPVSPFQWHLCDSEKLYRPQLPVSPTRSTPPSVHPSASSNRMQPPRTIQPITPLNIRKRTQPKRPSSPAMDNVWEDFLVDTEEDVSGLDLHGVLKASLELDFLVDAPSPRPGPESRNMLPYLSRTPERRPRIRPRVSKPLPLSPPSSPGHFVPSRPAPSPPRPVERSPPRVRTPVPHVPYSRTWHASDSDTTPDMGSSTSSLGSLGPWDDLLNHDGHDTTGSRIEWGYAL